MGHKRGLQKKSGKKEETMRMLVVIISETYPKISSIFFHGFSTFYSVDFCGNSGDKPSGNYLGCTGFLFPAIDLIITIDLLLSVLQFSRVVSPVGLGKPQKS